MKNNINIYKNIQYLNHRVTEDSIDILTSEKDISIPLRLWLMANIPEFVKYCEIKHKEFDISKLLEIFNAQTSSWSNSVDLHLPANLDEEYYLLDYVEYSNLLLFSEPYLIFTNNFDVYIISMSQDDLAYILLDVYKLHEVSDNVNVQITVLLSRKYDVYSDGSIRFCDCDKHISKYDFLNVIAYYCNNLRRSSKIIVKELNNFNADFVYFFSNYAETMIISECLFLADIIKDGITTYTKIKFNKYFDLILAKSNVYLLDTEKTRYGKFDIGELLFINIPTSEKSINLKYDCSISLSNNYPHIEGPHIGMGFTKSEYKRFLEILRNYLDVYAKGTQEF